ncbi:leucine-rich repeat domain-containing protein [Psychrobacter alimentarius]|uniref:leucine-rich repeat domain-containing protein n=1 Tax=Psychrobacter alimentarius TaxID=261164 RepID=UPI003FD17DD8
MFLIFLVVALLLAIPTFGISLIVFIGFYWYKTTIMKHKLVQTLTALPDVTHDSEGYVVDIKYEQILAFAEEIGDIRTYRCSLTPKKDLPTYIEFEVKIDNYKYMFTLDRYGDKSIMKRIGNPFTIGIHEWLSSFYHNEDKAPNEILLKKKLILGSAAHPEYMKDIGILPSSIFQLEILESLHLQRCALTYIQEDILNLKNLKDLKLGCNNLSTLPKSIGYLKKLEILTMWGNDIVHLPEEVGFLVNLRGLDLSDNPIKRLPDSIDNLVNLKTLYLHGVPNLKLTIQQQCWIHELYQKGCDLFIDKHLLTTDEKPVDDEIYVDRQY